MYSVHVRMCHATFYKGNWFNLRKSVWKRVNFLGKNAATRWRKCARGAAQKPAQMRTKPCAWQSRSNSARRKLRSSAKKSPGINKLFFYLIYILCWDFTKEKRRFAHPANQHTHIFSYWNHWPYRIRSIKFIIRSIFSAYAEKVEKGTMKQAVI